MLKALRKLPVDISYSIRQSIGRIQEQPDTLRKVGMHVLFWTLKARRPLRIDELRHALATDFDNGIGSDDLSSDEDNIGSVVGEEGFIP